MVVLRLPFSGRPSKLNTVQISPVYHEDVSISARDLISTVDVSMLRPEPVFVSCHDKGLLETSCCLPEKCRWALTSASTWWKTAKLDDCRCFAARRFADAKVHIPDELDDVVDDEEDEEWREWGKPKKQPEFDPPPTDFSKMGLQEMQDEMMKRQFGPVFGFVKLQPGIRRSKETVTDIAMKWTKVARTGAVEAKFSGVDVSTIMFTMQKGQDALELKEFVLNQPEAYEIKIGDQLYRRPGDASFEEVFQKLQAEKSKDQNTDSVKDERHHEL